MSSVAVQFAEILEETARRVRIIEDEILLLIKIDGFSATFEDLIMEIVIDCKDEHMLDQDRDIIFSGG